LLLLFQILNNTPPNPFTISCNSIALQIWHTPINYLSLPSFSRSFTL